MGLVPKRARSDVRMHKSFTLQRLLGLVITVVIATALSTIVVDRLKIWFILFLIANYMILSGKSVENENKSFHTGLKQWLSYRFKHKVMYGDSNEQVQEQERSREREHHKKQRKKAPKDKVSEHSK